MSWRSSVNQRLGSLPLLREFLFLVNVHHHQVRVHPSAGKRIAPPSQLCVYICVYVCVYVCMCVYVCVCLMSLSGLNIKSRA